MNLLILAVLLAFSQAPSPKPRGTEHSASSAQNVQQQPDNREKISNPLIAKPVVPTSPNPADGEGAEKATADKEQPVRITKPVAITTKPDYPTWLFSALLVGVGGLQLWLLWGTLRATADNASAARLNAQAVITENRPWLLMDMAEYAYRVQNPYLVIPGTVPIGQERLSHCVFFFKNYGRTPAKVIEEVFELQIGDSPTDPPHGEIYDAKKPKRANSSAYFVFPPGECIPREARLVPQGFISREDYESVEGKTKFLWLCGFVKYRDTLERDKPVEYETRFCYVWETRLNTDKPLWSVNGPSKYNRAT